MLLPDIWGGGQLFAFSGLDGETGWPALVAVTLEDRVGLDFYSGARPRMWLALETKTKFADGSPKAPFAAIKPTVVAGDVIVIQLEVERNAGCLLRLACIDRNTMLGEVSAAAPGVRPYVVLDFTPPGVEADPGCAGEVIFAAEGDAAAPRWLGSGQQAFRLRSPRARLAIALDTGKSARQELLQSPLSASADDICGARMAFFDRLPDLHGAHDLRRRAYAKAQSVLKVNLESPQGRIPTHYGVPDRAPQRQMGLWETAFHAFGYARLDMAIARETLLAALSQAQDDGFLPSRITPDGERAEITQPPLLGWAAWALQSVGPDLDFLARCYPPLCRYLRWDLAHRDRDGDGLLEWAGAAESGMDNSPRFDDGADFAAVDFNAFAAAEAAALGDIAEALGNDDDARTWRAEHARRAEAIEGRLWCEDDGIYYDRRPDGEFVRVKTCASFAPLFAGVASAERARRLAEHLSDGAQFWPLFPVPSVALDEATYSDDMWRGPAWLNYSFLLLHGLRRYGFDQLADELRERCLEQVSKWYGREGTLFEFYDPTGRTAPRRLRREGRVATHRAGGTPVITDYNGTAAIYVALAGERYGGER